MLPIKFNADAVSKLKDDELLKKIKEQKRKPKKSNNIMDVLEKIRQDVDKHLGEYKEVYRLITTKEELEAYIEHANQFGYIAIDTETTGLNPMVDDIVGLCLYFPGTNREEQAVYVPINHYDYFSDTRYEEGQIKREDVTGCLKKLTAKCIFHNAQFDIRVIKHNLGVVLKCYWDTLIASTMLNENEEHGLKYQHSKYISHKDEKTFSELFGAVTFKYVPIEYAYLYAANDARDTFELFEFQKKFLNPDHNREDFRNLYWVFANIEMPMVEVIVALEDNGVAIDMNYLNKIHDIYHKNLDDALQICNDEALKIKDKIDIYNSTHPKQLKLPLNVGSPQQLGILFYGVLGCSPVDGKSATSTDEDVMNEFQKEYPVAKAILAYRSALKTTSTYIDNIPNILHTDGRVHTKFNSIGAVTGRMSSSEPINLQNIPSDDGEFCIRKMYIGQTTTREVELRKDNAYILNREEEVQLEDDSWVWAETVKTGDILKNGDIVKDVIIKDFKVLIGIKNQRKEENYKLVARTRRIIQGSDYSAQEPRLLSQLCGDEGMLQAYRDGKDLYVEIASISFHRPYKMCLEHFPKGCPIKEVDGHWEYAKLKSGEDDGIYNFEDLHKYQDPDFDPSLYDYDKLADGENDTFKEGKKYRGQAKKILLGIMYSRGEKSIAEQLGCEIDEAREIKNNVYDSFPKIKELEDKSKQQVIEKGFVTTLWGRKRRLHEYNLPAYSFYYLTDKDEKDLTKQVPLEICNEITTKLDKLYWKKRDDFIQKCKDIDRILVVDNRKTIAKAGRQIINSQVQGSAADMSKLALIKIFYDEELNKRGVKEIIPVHDEILIETPLRYAKYVKKRFAEDMETAAKPKLTIPVCCDVVSANGWYHPELDLDAELHGLPEI